MFPAEFSFKKFRVLENGNCQFSVWFAVIWRIFFSPDWFWFPVFALLGKWEGFPRNANCVRHLPLPPPYRSDQYRGLCQSFCCYSTTVALPSFQSMPLFTAHPPPSYFFSLEPFVEVALMSVVGRAADNLKCRHLIFSCYNLRFFFRGEKGMWKIWFCSSECCRKGRERR